MIDCGPGMSEAGTGDKELSCLGLWSVPVEYRGLVVCICNNYARDRMTAGFRTIRVLQSETAEEIACDL